VDILRFFMHPLMKKKSVMFTLNMDNPKVRQGEVPGANGNATA